MSISFSEFVERKPKVTRHEVDYDGENIVIYTRKMSAYHRNLLFSAPGFGNIVADAAVKRKDGVSMDIADADPAGVAAMLNYPAARVAYTLCNADGELAFDNVEQCLKALPSDFIDAVSNIVEKTQPMDSAEDAEKK